MRRDGLARIATALALLLLFAGCSRFSLTRPDPRRGAYRQTAHEVEIRPEATGRAEAFRLAQTAQARLMAGDAAAARSAAERALRLDPASAAAHSLLALSLDALGKPGEAGPHYLKSVELSPANGALLNDYGAWLCNNGQPAQSLEWFARALASPGYPSPDAALANSGTCAMRAGDPVRAERELRQAIAIAPRNPVALIGLARLAFQAGRGLEARAFVERRLDAAPADADALQLASQIEQQLGDAAAAARYVQRIRAEFPQDSSSAHEGGNR